MGVKKRDGAVFVIVFLFIINASIVLAHCYDGGQDPIPLCTCGDLNRTRENLNANYQLQNNINCSNTSLWAAGAGFTPIGDLSTPFQGNFDGAGYNITDLYMYWSTFRAGLFGDIDGSAVVENVGLINVNVTGTSGYVGGLVGDQESGTLINNSFTTGYVNSTGNFYVGGLVGVTEGDIYNSYSSANVYGPTKVGGLVGEQGLGTINRCYATGNVYGNSTSVGGLIGMTVSNTYLYNSYATGNVTSNETGIEFVGGLIGRCWGPTTINSCYATGNVYGYDSVGGLTGSLYWYCTLNNSYARGNVTGNYKVGGLVGYLYTSAYTYNSYATGSVSGSTSAHGLIGLYSTGNAFNNFWDNETSGQTDADGSATGKSTVDMKNLSTYTNTSTNGLSSPWDFLNNPGEDAANQNVWHINGTINDGYPILIGIGLGAGFESPVVTLNSPADDNITQSASVNMDFNCSATDVSGPLVNISLLLTNSTNENLSINQTTVVGGSSNSSNWTVLLNEGMYSWNCYAYDYIGIRGQGVARTLYVDGTVPVPLIDSPAADYVNDTWDPLTVTINCTVTDNVLLKNVSLYITNSTNESFSLSSTTSLSGVAGMGEWNLSLGKGNYTFGCMATDYSGNVNWTANQTFELNFSDSVSPGFTDIDNVSFREDRPVIVDFNATDDYSFDCFSVNDTMNFDINCTGHLSNITALIPDSIYWLNVTINDSYGNVNSTVIFVNITLVGRVGITLVTPTENSNVTQNTYYNVTVNVSCYRDDCGMINVTLGYYNETIILYDDFEGSGWASATANSDCAYSGDLWDCDSNSNDYDFYHYFYPYSGSYSLQIDDWDTFDYAKGLWKNITPSTACNGNPCFNYSVSFYEHNYGLNTASEFCIVWVRQSDASIVNIWNCTDGDACDDDFTDSTPESNDYVKRNETFAGVDLTDSQIELHVGGRLPGSSDYCFFDEFRVVGELNGFEVLENLTQNVSLNVNESVLIVWHMNATGMVGLNQTISVYANRTYDFGVNNLTETYNLTITEAGISVVIDFPSYGYNTTDTGVDINYSVSEPDACWYNNMTDNITLVGCSNITSVTWAEGEHNITVYANDSNGDIGSSLVRFRIDLTSPGVVISVPTLGVYSSDTGVDVNYSVSDLSIDKCWYTNDTMDVNETLVSCANITTVTWSEGEHNVTVYVNDTAGNMNYSTTNFIIDTIYPLVIVDYPSNNSNHTDYGLDVKYNLTETNLDRCWYNNMTDNITLVGCANITSASWSVGEHNITVFVNDTVGHINSSSVNFVILQDTDQDGLLDVNDTLLYNESAVTTSGVSDLNITVGGNKTNETFSGVKEIRINDGGTLLMNFSHNFSNSTFDLSNVTIIVGTNSVIVNVSGQVQGNKSIYIADNNFASLCVKDAEVTLISEISSGCDGVNETDLTDCLDGSMSSGGVVCTDLGSRIKIDNLRHSAARGTPQSTSTETVTSGGSGGDPIYDSCGNGYCENALEDCLVCPEDCGECVTTTHVTTTLDTATTTTADMTTTVVDATTTTTIVDEEIDGPKEDSPEKKGLLPLLIAIVLIVVMGYYLFLKKG